jgi:hypothetical protein
MKVNASDKNQSNNIESWRDDRPTVLPSILYWFGGAGCKITYTYTTATGTSSFYVVGAYNMKFQIISNQDQSSIDVGDNATVAITWLAYSPHLNPSPLTLLSSPHYRLALSLARHCVAGPKAYRSVHFANARKIQSNSSSLTLALTIAHLQTPTSISLISISTTSQPIILFRIIYIREHKSKNK